MTDTTAPDAITPARAAEMLALAPLQSAQPPKDRVFYARQHVPMKWTPYKPTSQEVKRGKKGRWQQRRAYGLGWENADEEPQAGAWIEDVINHPDRRLAAHGAGEGLRGIADRIRAQATCLEGYAEQNGYSGKAPASVFHWQATHFRDLAAEIDRALPTPTDAGSTTREGGEGVPAGMKPWTGGPRAPSDWGGGLFMLRSGHVKDDRHKTTSWFHDGGPYDVVAYTPVATTPSPDASPDSGEAEWITLRSLESDPRHLVVEVGGREVINTYFADGPVYHTAHPSPEAPANRQEAGEVCHVRELLAEAYKDLSGRDLHASDCATSRAPAETPGPCDCYPRVLFLNWPADKAEEPVGWKGENPPTLDHFCCEFCGEAHLDCTLIPHRSECPVTAARAALTSPKNVKGGEA